MDENGDDFDEDETPEPPSEPGLPGDTPDGSGDDTEFPEDGPEPPADLDE